MNRQVQRANGRTCIEVASFGRRDFRQNPVGMDSLRIGNPVVIHQLETQIAEHENCGSKPDR